MPHSHLRISERLNKEDFKNSGFTIRTHTPTYFLDRLFIGLSILLICFVGIYYYNVLTGFYILFGASCITALISRYLERSKRIQQASEFLNSLLSSIVGHGYRFCLVTRPNGDIIYANRDFQQCFTQFVAQDNLTMSEWGRMQDVAEGQLKELLTRISGNISNSATVTVKMEDGRTENITLSIEPIDYPKGYVLIRAAK